MKKQYYAVVYWDAMHKKVGIPHHKTGNKNHACRMVIFDDKTERDNWVKEGVPHNQNRVAIQSKRALRKLFLAEDMEDFNRLVENCNFNDEEYRRYLTSKYFLQGN